MKSSYKLSCAVMAILSAHAAASYAAEAPKADSGEIGEVVVTAQRRSESIQNVPIAIQALTGETLSQLQITTFDDYVKYLPNVSSASWGPGQSLIFMRGLSSGALGTQGSGTDANFPNVAVYLDDQSAQMPYRNLDVYAADIERVEVLEGPQGTLFGAGAQAGVIRYITNKPKLNVTEGGINAGYGTTAHGDNNSNFDAVVNLPLITDKLAIRGVFYNESRGGYINNVPGTATNVLSDLGFTGPTYPQGQCVTPAVAAGPGGVPAAIPAKLKPGCVAQSNNNNTVASAINPVTYQGFRLSALYKISDDWNVLVSQAYQGMSADGVFYQEPFSTDGVPLPPLSVTIYNPGFDKDRFENTAWTLNGKLGDLKLVYTGGYLVRNVAAQSDYTGYSRGNYAHYYQCTPKKDVVSVANPMGVQPICYPPSAFWTNTQRNTHQNHEFRLSTPDDWRLRGIVGAFWEDFELTDDTTWHYKSLPACNDLGKVPLPSQQAGCMTNIVPHPLSTITIPGSRGDSASFFDDIQRGYKQYAFFTSWDYDLIPKVLTATAGTRWYNFKNTQTGNYEYSFGTIDCATVPYPGPGSTTRYCAGQSAHNENALNLNSSYTGFKSRANLTWHVTPDAMLYYTYSQGYRPGGFNRSANGPYIPALNPLTGLPTGPKEYKTPQRFDPDTLTNSELGWKSEWMNHRVLVNGAVYQEDWKNVQEQFFNPAFTGNLSYVTNGANYRVKGVELQVVARATQGLTLQASAAWNSSELTNSPFLIGNVKGTPDFGLPLKQAPNFYGSTGDNLPQSPPFEFSARARYEWAINDYQAFFQVGGQHTGHSRSLPGHVPSIASNVGNTVEAFDQPGYSTYDASAGIAKEAWSAQIFGQNLTDTRGLNFISSSEAIQTQTVIRPRVMGVRVQWKF